MSQINPTDLTSQQPKGKMSPLNRNQHNLPAEENMHVDEGYIPENTLDESRENISVEDSRGLLRNECLQDSYNANPGVQQSTPSNPIEQMDTMSDTCSDNDEAASMRVVEARFKNVSQYKSPHHKSATRVSDGTIMIRCLPWKILAIFQPPESGFMGFFVQCNVDSSSQTWSCSAKATLILAAQQPNCKNKELKIQHTFNHKEYDWGFQNFINYNDLFNPENGFIRTSDDSICLQAIVKADAPHGADWDSVVQPVVKRYCL